MGVFAGRLAPGKANIVLIHGIWADGSGWSQVIEKLQAQGHFVIAEQNPLTSLADDVALTRRIVSELEGPTILVGHSYGGFIISEAATNAPGVVGLVYIAAFALDEGETIVSAGSQFPPLEAYQHLLIDSQGFAWLDPDHFPQNFANDLDPAVARVLASAQAPAAASVLNTSAGSPAWKSLPSWYLVATKDRMIHPDQQRWMAKRSGATTREVEASHVPFLSQPDAVAAIILAAAETAVKA